MKLYFVDLFCGAGGVTTGIHEAEADGRSIAEVLACVNHDPKAIQSHKGNHRDVLHFVEDVRTLDLSPIVKIVRDIRSKYPDAIICLWASLECTNFSKAKGGLPREADSRTLAEHLIRYIELLNPDSIWIENVEEFMSWGPLDAKGKPINKKGGIDYLKWVNSVKQHGYSFDWKILNAADYGAYTSRKRFFAQFQKPHIPIAWPEATHAKKAVSDQFGSLKKWKPVKEVLDFNDEGNSIFERKKELSEKTLERIYAGLIKYVAGGKENFLLKYNSTSKNGAHTPPSVDEPCPTVATQNRLGIVHTSFIQKYYSGRPAGKVSSVEDPAGSIITSANQALVQTKFIMQNNNGNPNGKVTSVDNPSRTLTGTGGNLNIVNPKFLTNYYSNGGELKSIEEPCGSLSTKDRVAIVQTKYIVNYQHSSKCNSVDDPSPTITTKDKYAIVQPKYWIDKQYSGSDNHQSVDGPAGSILGNDKHCLVKAEYFLDRQFSSGTKHQSVDEPAGSLLTVPKMNLISCKWIMNTNFNNVGSSVEAPAPSITANRKHHYIINPSWGGNNGSVDEPCCTVVARQDKAPLYLVATELGEVAHAVYDTDCETMIKIKEFMVIYGIVDIKMRMLKVPELLKIQGFPDNYYLAGNQADQKKFIGNSVVPLMAKELILASYNGIKQYREAA